MITQMIKFYDTSSLLTLGKLPEEYFVISDITLAELEEIKDSSRKTDDIRAKARLISKQLFEAQNYEVSNHDLSRIDLPINNDTKILSSAIRYQAITDQEISFVTNDICLFNLVKNLFPKVEQVKFHYDDYTGYTELSLTNEELANFYSNPNLYSENLLLNEYLILKDCKEEVYKQTEQGIAKVPYPIFKSEYFGTIKPRDEYQLAAMDSLSKNEITLLGGPAGSGKTFLALGYLFSLLEKGKIDRIVVFCNPVVARNAAKLGYYPGS
jgi:predicted ribonuclease YlaK